MKTIEPLDPSAYVGQRVGLSEKDAEQGNLLYNCESMVALYTNQKLST